MQQVSAQKVTVNFECEHCGKQVNEYLTSAIENGAPICCQGDQMDLVDVEVDTKMQFG